MRRRRFQITAIIATAMLLLPATAAFATDGHFLHGIGAVQSSMGGAGIAAPLDILGTFYLNPAGLVAFKDNQTRIALGFEVFKPQRSVTSGFGPLQGTTVSASDFVPIPSFGWVSRLSDRVVIGIAGLGIGGFGVNYSGSGMLPNGFPENPVLAPRPFGFGQVFSNYQLMKFSPALAVEVTDNLWLGAAVNVDWASLQVDPMPVGAPAMDAGPDGAMGTPDDQAFFSRASATDGAFGLGYQVGLLYRINDMVQVGAAYTSEQSFQDFEFNTLWENPNIQHGAQAFGMPRTITFGLDIPAVLGGGVALHPLPNLVLAGDVRYLFYESTDGFALENPDQPFNLDGSVAGFGWKNILVYGVGGQLTLNERVSLRAGYNHSDNPVPDSLSMINVPAPALVKDHVTLGVGFAIDRRLSINAAYYHAFKNTGTGPLLGPAGPILGSSVTNELSENSLLMSFSFTTRGSIY